MKHRWGHRAHLCTETENGQDVVDGNQEQVVSQMAQVGPKQGEHGEKVLVRVAAEQSTCCIHGGVSLPLQGAQSPALFTKCILQFLK